MTELPPWTGNDKAMREWLDGKIVDYHGTLMNETSDKTSFEELEAAGIFDAPDQSPDSDELSAASLGDLEPLRRKYPHLDRAGVLCLPPKKRGDRYSVAKLADRKRRSIIDLSTHDDGRGQPKNVDDLARAAALDVPIIKKLWQEHFGKKNRKEGERKAEWFAAKLWNMSDVSGEAAVKRAVRRMKGS